MRTHGVVARPCVAPSRTWWPGRRLPSAGERTSAYEGESKYLRSFGSIEDLLALSLDTEMEVVEPPARWSTSSRPGGCGSTTTTSSP